VLEISLLLLLSLFVSSPIIKKIQEEKRQKHQNLLALSSYLLEIQNELEELPTDIYLQKKWLYENYIDEILEIVKSNKAILNHLDRELSPDIFDIYEDQNQWLEYVNYDFFENELKAYNHYFNTIESNPLTPMQRMAVITDEENNLILAGAGSGKTSVILAKVGYILKKEYATEDEILILAFNKKAQQELQHRIDSKLNVKVTIKTFHALGKSIVDRSYGGNTSDFEEMINKAIQAIKEERYHSSYRYIFIDEFQDISEERNRFILALKRQNSANITVVGDDWQAINKFAGSNIDIIQNFEHYYGATALIKLDYTFRFNKDILEASQNFILKNPKQIEKNIKTIKESTGQTLYLYWYHSSKEMDEYIEQIIQLIRRKTQKNVHKNFHKKSIKILSRYGFYEPKNLKHLKKSFSDYFDISFNTIHGSKGLEADYIIISHLESGKFGFPSEQNLEQDHDEEAFLYAEERRLFYVAMTRAKEKIFFMVNKKIPSSFISELQEENEIYELNPHLSF